MGCVNSLSPLWGSVGAEARPSRLIPDPAGRPEPATSTWIEEMDLPTGVLRRWRAPIHQFR